MTVGLSIRKITKVSKNKKVYDFTVDGAHHYLLANGIVSHNSYVPTQKLGGGAGLEYASSTIIFLTRAKDKDDKTKEVTGSIITANLKKSRLTVVDKKVSTLLDFREGLDPYYGLLPIALKANIVKKVGNKYQFPDGVTAFESAILKSPENFYTPEILDSIDKECQNIFLYGKGDIEEEEEVHETEKKSKKKETA